MVYRRGGIRGTDSLSLFYFLQCTLVPRVLYLKLALGVVAAQSPDSSTIWSREFCTCVRYIAKNRHERDEVI